MLRIRVFQPIFSHQSFLIIFLFFKFRFFFRKKFFLTLLNGVTNHISRVTDVTFDLTVRRHPNVLDSLQDEFSSDCRLTYAIKR